MIFLLEDMFDPTYTKINIISYIFFMNVNKFYT